MSTVTIVDAWVQHPSPAFLGHDMFASLRRWMGLDAEAQALFLGENAKRVFHLDGNATLPHVGPTVG